MRSYLPLIGIAREGWLVMLAVAMLAVSIYYSAGSGAVLFSLLALLPLLAYFFFDRNREVLSKARGVLAPVDGTVIQRRECHDPWLEREAIRIRIRVDCWGAYSLRSPVEAEAQAPPAVEPAQSVSILRTDEGEHVLISASRAGLFGARPVWATFGDRVGQGRRCGLRRLAKEIDLFIPASARVEVALGARVRCGQTLIATLLRKSPA